MTAIWHPFTQLKGFAPLGRVVRASGAHLHLSDGRVLLDGIASWWVNLHGHSHPALVKAISEQVAAFDQVILADFTHQPAEDLTAGLVKVLPGSLDHVFYSDDGSTSVEVALKMAWQAQGILGETQRHRFVAFEGGYHGDTLGAMSVGARDVFTAPFDNLLREATFLPWDDPEAAEAFFAKHGHEVVAMIVEPLMQGANGMQIGSPDNLRRIFEAAKEAGAFFIADEVATGFGRTGTMWAVEQAGIVPDLLCMSKAITGGTLAMGATACTAELFDLFLGDRKQDGFLHGHSYTGNPICCAAAVASLKLYETEGTLDRIATIGGIMASYVDRFAALDGVSGVRNLGAMFAFDLTGGPGGYLDPAGKRVQALCLQEGLYIRPLGNVVYLMPPVCLTDDECHHMMQVLLRSTETALLTREVSGMSPAT